ncbi:MAG TPA: tRNA (adenosine(37)-N6)-threonylcarbamoyltransferase complex ATPase subunit type 1 TsaE [Prolixibacteraceae bacterium]|nr:tRNA (adenosine(37)-N6)-threonylcarbamoyltransferase complex ATPase subunit type 1 TsaE [Prolixibacteraceae bacterium]
MNVIELKSISDIEKAASQFIKNMGQNKVFAFYGEMGAGKTTFIKAICRALGVNENITSPTFALINEYSTKNGDPIYHFDCYRLKNLAEAYDIGAEEYFYSNHICFIEWPEKIEELLPTKRADVTISIKKNQCREIVIIEK